MMGGFERLANRVSSAVGRPRAFLIAFLIVIIWGLSGPIFHWSDTWQLVINTGTTIVTFRGSKRPLRNTLGLGIIDHPFA